MRKVRAPHAAAFAAYLMSSAAIAAGPVYQPQGANLTLGDVTHGNRVQSASSNPAAAAADRDRSPEKRIRGTVVSAAAGLEYGNIDDLFDFYDRVTSAYEPSEPGTGGGPGQLPENKPGGIDLGQIWDALDPDAQEAIDAIAGEVATQAALLALIAVEGYGKAWVAADAPFVLGNNYMGGAWTFGVNWSGTAKAFGAVQPIQFSREDALQRLDDWLTSNPASRPEFVPLSDEVVLEVSPVSDEVVFTLENDSSIVTKSTQTTEFNLGYSRPAWSNESGTLYLGAEARLYLMRLSRLSVRFGDITDSEALFDAIRDAEFRNDTRLGVDLGALWVGNNYQLGLQVTDVNEPEFTFPDVDLTPYRTEAAINFLASDTKYRKTRQVKLEASLFSRNRKWSTHIGADADPATDPMGDEFQWLTLSAGFATDSVWVPGFRVGYRQNLAGTELRYASLGLTAFKIVNFDLSSTLDTVRIDGRDLPQGLMLSIGFEITW